MNNNPNSSIFLQMSKISKKVSVENKKYSLTVHYRNETKDTLYPQIISEAYRIIKNFGWRPNQGNKAVEAKPDIDWHKGMNLSSLI